MARVLIESHFFPSVEYFCLLQNYDDIQLEGHEHYVKQSFRNRCYILSVHGKQRLTLPLTAKRGKVVVSQVEVDYATRWQANLWRTLQSAYANSPYFEHYADDVHRVLHAGERKLLYLNQEILSMCLTWLGWSKKISRTTEFGPAVASDDFRNQLSDRVDFSNRTILLPQPYQQVFGNTFVPNLSILDLVCCVGPEAGRVITDSRAGQ